MLNGGTFQELVTRTNQCVDVDRGRTELLSGMTTLTDEFESYRSVCVGDAFHDERHIKAAHQLKLLIAKSIDPPRPFRVLALIRRVMGFVQSALKESASSPPS
jgi:hypothetical protein